MKIGLISTSTYPSDQGLRTISSNLKREGYKVNLIFLPMEEDYSREYPKKVLEQLVEICKEVDIIGIASYVSTSVRAIQVINELKKLNKIIVWGGIHATISPDKCIEYVDYVCRGEAEEAMIEFVKIIENKRDVSKVKNFWVRKGGKLYKNDVRELKENLDELKEPDYDIEDHYILDKERIRRFKEEDLNGQIFFQTERGCPNACTYCSNGLLRDLYRNKGKLIRKYSINYVINEMKRLKNKFRKLRYFDIRDETFFVRSLDEIREFSERYEKEIGLRFKCLADPPTIDDEKLKLLVEAGLTDIIVGIQGCENVNFNVYCRYIKDEQVVKAAKILNKYNIAVMYDVITSNPYEDKEDVLNLINLLIKVPKPYFLSVNNLVFFLGTPLYERAVKDKIIKTRKDTAFDLNYWDRWKHIKLKKKNAYLNLVLNLMRGVVTEKRYGLMPDFVLRFLIKEKMIKFNEKIKVFTYFVGNIVQIMDFFREKIAKPVYRSMPLEFKVWYDSVRYRV